MNETRRFEGFTNQEILRMDSYSLYKLIVLALCCSCALRSSQNRTELASVIEWKINSVSERDGSSPHINLRLVLTSSWEKGSPRIQQCGLKVLNFCRFMARIGGKFRESFFEDQDDGTDVLYKLQAANLVSKFKISLLSVLCLADGFPCQLLKLLISRCFKVSMFKSTNAQSPVKAKEARDNEGGSCRNGSYSILGP